MLNVDKNNVNDIVFSNVESSQQKHKNNSRSEQPPKTKSYTERLKWAMDRIKITQKELAKTAGTSQQNVQRLCDFKKKAVGSSYTATFARTLGVSAQWLATGEGDCFKGVRAHVKTFIPESYIRKEQNKNRVPLITWQQAGSGCKIAASTVTEWIYCPVKHGPRTFALKVNSESMHNPNGRPSFEPGDLLLVDPDAKVNHSSIVVIKWNSRDITDFRRLVIDSGRMFLLPLNPIWVSKPIPVDEDIQIRGVIFGKVEIF
jgi:SOS-response transcriptional repressor LexA